MSNPVFQYPFLSSRRFARDWLSQYTVLESTDKKMDFLDMSKYFSEYDFQNN